ncbi:hypothetical protein F442_19731 [Phytophthora nicotianae P10297]|uniref:Ubiquitin-like protease family profile domain-containing protein n=1 Tax=Phytophthora nicotianae P10297 TaxID=1317064 RepID=W2Y8S8_PHYNI|nr:hypothetical protein F442_19731 [Phytophthora nicotianae P10297]
MRCHRAFWVYASDNGERISEKAATFAQQQAAQEQPGANKTAENWLRSRAGRSLKDAWLKEPPETRQKYYLENPDGGFPLEEYPTGFRDGRTDRSRYPRMICADVERPQVLQNSVHGAQDRAHMPIDLSVSEQLRGFERQRKELLRAAFDAEMTALAFATKQKDIHLVISRSAALVECLGGQIAVMVPAQIRASVLSVIAEVAMHVKGAATQMVMYSDDEAKDALLQSQTCVINANASLEKYVCDAAETSQIFASIYEGREHYTAKTTKHLKNLYWIGEERPKEILQETGDRPANITLVNPAAQYQLAMATTASGASVALEAPVRASSPDEVAPAHRRKRLKILPVTPQSSLPSVPNLLSEDARDVSADVSTAAVGGDASSGGNDCGNEPGSDEDLNRSEAIAVDSNSDVEFSSGGESDESSNSDESVFEDANVEKADTSVPHRFFRKRFPKDSAILVWTDLEESGNSRTVHVFPSDLNSLEADASLTQTALEFFIYRDLPRENGVVCPCGSGLYVLMERARRTRKAVTQQRLFGDLVALFNWSYQYLLLPVSGGNHWSFLVIENFMHAGPTKSMKPNQMHQLLLNGGRLSTTQNHNNQTVQTVGFTFFTTWMRFQSG